MAADLDQHLVGGGRARAGGQRFHVGHVDLHEPEWAAPGDHRVQVVEEPAAADQPRQGICVGAIAHLPHLSALQSLGKRSVRDTLPMTPADRRLLRARLDVALWPIPAVLTVLAAVLAELVSRIPTDTAQTLLVLPEI